MINIYMQKIVHLLKLIKTKKIFYTLKKKTLYKLKLLYMCFYFPKTKRSITIAMTLNFI